MKRIASLLLIATFVICSAVNAKADGIDIKVKGQWDFAFGWASNKQFKSSYMGSKLYGGNGQEKARANDAFNARQRIRTQINFITSEYLQGVLMFEIGGLDWGRNGGKVGRSSGAGLDADGVNVETKRAYLDWVIPNTEISVRMGIQGMALPATRMGSPVLEADMAGIVANAPITDWLGVSLFWARPFNNNLNDTEQSVNNLSDEVDVFGAVLPMKFDGITFSPWFVYGFVGTSSAFYDYTFNYSYDNSVLNDNHARGWWVGAHLEVTLLDPLEFNLEGVYGHLNRADLTGFFNANRRFPTDIGAKGWYIAATLDYKLDFMTPGIFGWYASGDDKDDFLDDGYLGGLPAIGTDGGNFRPTSFGGAGYFGVGNGDDWITTLGTPAGSWGLGIQFADISFIEDLSHTFRVAYYRGTNDADLAKYVNNRGLSLPKYGYNPLYLTDKDYVWEINFDHQYNIYENLSMNVELGWLRLHSDRETWETRPSHGLKENDNAWKAELNFKYTF